MDTGLPLIRTKIRVPQRRPFAVQRGRLLDLLHANVQQKLILISAGAGYGKTSLLIDFCHEADFPVCWYSLDGLDTQLATFVEYLTASIQARFAGFGDRVLATLAHPPSGSPPVEAYARVLLDEISRNARDFFLLVLDDYHEVAESEPVNLLVDTLLRYLPENCHIALATRSIPTRLPLTRLVARQEAFGLGTEHLAFTEDEIGQLLAQLGHDDLSTEQVKRLAERSEGWVTGILLATQAGLTATTSEVVELSGSTSGVFAYMAEQVLEQQPRDRVEFLLGSALLDQMSPGMCNALLDRADSHLQLQQLAEANLFTHPLDHRGDWYQYHQLFREFLRARLGQTDPASHRRLTRAAAEIYAARGQWAEAIARFTEIGALEQAAGAIEAIAQEAYDSGRWDRLAAWIDGLPIAVLDVHPRLALFRGQIQTEQGDPAGALARLAQARDGFAAQDDAVGESRTLIAKAVALRFRGRYEEAAAACRQALAQGGSTDLVTRGKGLRNLAICHAALGETERGIELLQEAHAAAKRAGADLDAAYCAHDLGTLEAMRGHLREARRRFHQALEHLEISGTPAGLALVYINLGVVHHHLGEYQAAASRFEQGIDRARQAGDLRTEAYLIASQADLLRDTGRWGEAVETYEGAMALAPRTGDPSLRVYLLDAQANAFRLQGDLDGAARTLLEATDLATDESWSRERALLALSQALLAHARGEPHAAERGAETIGLLADCQATRDLARAHLHLAAWALEAGQPEAAREHVRQAADLGEVLGSYQFAVAEGPALLTLWAAARHWDLGALPVAEIIAEVQRLFHGPVAQPASPSPEARRTAIALLGLDGGRVLVDGEPVREWESAPARIMAFLFGCHQAGLRKEQAIEMLWPEASPARGNSSFHSTKYRVHKALGVDDAIIYDRSRGVYAANPALDWECDVATFFDLAATDDSADDAGARWDQALAMYLTPFLEICDAPWADALRARAAEAHRRVLLARAQAAARSGDLDIAEALFTTMITADPYDEVAYRGAIWCRAQRNDRSGALELYARCRATLQNELDIAPEQETQALVRAVREGRPLPELFSQ